MSKYGLVLGGGGAKGAYQVGVLKALEEAKMLRYFTIASGTSIGAINTFILLNGLDIKTMYSIWQEFDNDAIYGRNRVHDTVTALGLFNTEGILSKILKHIHMNVLRKSKIKGYATLAKVPEKGILSKLNLKKYEKEVVFLNTADDPLKAVMASAAIPIVFGEKALDGHKYVDGGVVDNLPFTPVIEAGADIIFSIGLNPKEMRTKPYVDKVWIDLTPLEELGPFPKTSLDFSQTKIAEYFTLGYHNMKMMLHHLKKEKMIGFNKTIKLKKGHFYNLKDVFPERSEN